MNISLQKLINREVKQALLEVRSTPGNPNTFWLVTSVGPKVPDKMMDLAKGRLEGVSGISDNKKILMHWLGIGRNAVLVLNANDLLKNNDGITKIWYDDLEQLTDNNMMLLRRIFNADDAPRGNSRILKNIWSRMYQEMIKVPSGPIQKLGQLMRDGYIPSYDVFDKYENGALTIDSPRELARYFKAEVDQIAKKQNRDDLLDIQESWWYTYVKKAILYSVKTYSSEGEWVVEDSTLQIPKGSKLLVAVHVLPENMPIEAQEKMKRGEEPKAGEDFPFNQWTGRSMDTSMATITSIYKYGLDKQYDVRFIDMNKFKAVQLKMQTQHTFG